jgi:putative sterol carrier protein
MGSFKSADEFREVMDRCFELMSADPDMGPKLRDADTAQRWEFPDLDLVVNIAPAENGDSVHNLKWEWSDEVDWEPAVKMKMTSEVANRYFQGEENVAMAIARGKIKASGSPQKALALIPVTKPVFPKYLEMVRADYPHLVD